MADQIDIDGRIFLPVMAAPAEWGSELKERFTPLFCGVGPVEASVTLTQYLATHKKPDVVVSLGSCGSNRMTQGKVYQVSEISYRDMDASGFGFEKGVTPFTDFGPVRAMPLHLPGHPAASLSTGGNVVSGRGYDEIDADLVDMETWALLRAADRYDIPVFGLRGVSDGHKPVSKYEDWTAYLHHIDVELAKVWDRLADLERI